MTFKIPMCALEEWRRALGDVPFAEGMLAAKLYAMIWPSGSMPVLGEYMAVLHEVRILRDFGIIQDEPLDEKVMQAASELITARLIDSGIIVRLQ